MSIQPASRELLFAGFIPQAELEFPPGQIHGKIELIEDCDDLDDFTGGAFTLNGDYLFTIKRYKSSAPNMFTVYFPRNTDAGMVKELVHTIIKDFRLPASALKWERSQNPDF